MGEVSEVNFERLERVNGIKIIGIETLRKPNDKTYSEYFPERWDVSSYISRINLSYPLLDFKGNKNNKLSLKTIWWDYENPFWDTHLEDERGYVLGETNQFGRLDEPFSGYSERRLIKWQKQAFLIHTKTLFQLENAFYNGEEIPKNFLVEIRPSSFLI